MPKRHTVTKTLNGGMPIFTMQCPFDLADETRPCWVDDESNVPVPPDHPDATVCGWSTWVEGTAEGCLATGAPIVFDAIARFTHNTDPVFTLVAPRLATLEAAHG